VLERLANARAEHEHLSVQPPDAVRAWPVLHTRLVEASARGCERAMRRLEEELARLTEVAESMTAAAAGARAAVDAAAAVLGDEWARAEPLLHTVPAARLHAYAALVAAEHARELELKAAIVADLRRVGYSCAPRDAPERSRLRTLYLASWIMQPGRCGVGDESAEHCVRVLTCELL
jgi:hypothetical protein